VSSSSKNVVEQQTVLNSLVCVSMRKPDPLFSAPMGCAVVSYLLAHEFLIQGFMPFARYPKRGGAKFMPLKAM
jgi:hypothetical protein